MEQQKPIFPADAVEEFSARSMFRIVPNTLLLYNCVINC